MLLTVQGGGSTLAILPGQVISGVIDQNGGMASSFAPYLLVATGGNPGVTGYSWAVPPGTSKSYPPAIVIQPVGVVNDVSPQSLTGGVFPMPVEVSDGTTTVTGQVSVNLAATCNSGTGSSSYPCYTGGLTNQHISYLPSGAVGSPYAATIVTSGGTPPYTWVLGGGNLPPGVAIDQAKGILRGLPAESGTYSFFVLTSDSAGANTSIEIKDGVLAALFTVVIK